MSMKNPPTIATLLLLGALAACSGEKQAAEKQDLDGAKEAAQEAEKAQDAAGENERVEVQVPKEDE